MQTGSTRIAWVGRTLGSPLRLGVDERAAREGVISEATATRGLACQMYSQIFVTLPFRTVMAKTQWSSNILFVALIFPDEPTTRTRSPCATNSGGVWVCQFLSLRTPSEAQARQFRVPAVPAGQRPALARNDPLNICGN